MTHFLNIEIRDKNHKLYLDNLGLKVTSFCYPLDIETLNDYKDIETYLKGVYESYVAVCKENSFISVSISYLSEVSRTIPTLYTYEDNKFIKH